MIHNKGGVTLMTISLTTAVCLYLIAGTVMSIMFSGYVELKEERELDFSDRLVILMAFSLLWFPLVIMAFVSNIWEIIRNDR
jgi:hypothetical protein